MVLHGILVESAKALAGLPWFPAVDFPGPTFSASKASLSADPTAKEDEAAARTFHAAKPPVPEALPAADTTFVGATVVRRILAAAVPKIREAILVCCIDTGGYLVGRRFLLGSFSISLFLPFVVMLPFSISLFTFCCDALNLVCSARVSYGNFGDLFGELGNL
jgi:hypothetical protein